MRKPSLSSGHSFAAFKQKCGPYIAYAISLNTPELSKTLIDQQSDRDARDIYLKAMIADYDWMPKYRGMIIAVTPIVMAAAYLCCSKLSLPLYWSLATVPFPIAAWIILRKIEERREREKNRFEKGEMPDDAPVRPQIQIRAERLWHKYDHAMRVKVKPATRSAPATRPADCLPK